MIILINSSFYTKSGVFKRVLEDKDMLYIMMADSCHVHEYEIRLRFLTSG